MPYKYKLDRMCDNCPFADEGPGLQLRLSLGRKRWETILSGLRRGEHFLCHKTTSGEEDGEGNYIRTGDEKICAGSRLYQADLGIVSDAEQIMERIALMKKIQ